MKKITIKDEIAKNTNKNYESTQRNMIILLLRAMQNDLSEESKAKILDIVDEWIAK